jgi:hypothetical protein
MLQKLNTLIGNKYNYKGNVIVINEVKLVSTTYVVKTDKRTYNFFESEVDNFISELLDYVEKPIKKFMVENTPNTPNALSEKSTDLSEILYDTIDKVKKDRNYIGQANAICNIVSQMINIKKLELQLKK